MTTEKVEINLESTDLDELYAIAVGKMLESMVTFQRQGSNWTFDSIIGLELHTVKYVPLRGTSYIPLPPNFNRKKAIINIQNEDNECVKWCILRHLHPSDKNPQRVSSLKQHENELDMSDITKFENGNKIYVNVYGCEGKNVYPLRFSKQRNAVNLLLIKDFSRLASMQVSKHNGKNVFLWKLHATLQHSSRSVET